MDLRAHTRTRLALHALAEHLLTADLHRHTGRIGLRATPGGFGQPEFWADGTRRRLRVDGDRLVVLDGDRESWHHLGTLASAATIAGVELGAPSEVFTPETELSPDAPLAVDREAATRIAEWFGLTADAIEQLRRSNAGLEPAIVQLWPEHFDLATNMAEVNFGGSPGDGHIAEPYLYVGPWAPREGDFWNESFGATRLHSEIDGPADAVEFFTEGLRRATE
jgi:hypothetical protein